MARYRTTITSSTPPDAAFDGLADFTTVADWDPGVSRAVRVDSGDIVVGSAFDVDVALGGRDVTFRYVITELARPDRVVLRAKRGPMVSLDTITVEPGPDGGSRVTYDAVLELRGVLKVADPLLALGFGKVGDRAAAGLADHLDGSVTS